MEFLSSDYWIGPQIDYLLWLQNLRLHIGPMFDNFFLSLTKLGEIVYPTLFISIIYWCVDFEIGLYLFGVNSISFIFTLFLKSIACVYRPWIISSQVHPVESALPRAGGYSFPSGHSAMASSSWGALAFIYRKYRWLCAFLIFVVLLVGFSRNYVGVHTPQDVVIGILTSVIIIFIMYWILKWCEKDKQRYLYFLIAFNILAIAALYYILTKSYPMDYIGGKLLVNPLKARYIAVVYFGWAIGVMNGALLLKRFFNFNPKEGSVLNKVIRGTLGCVLLLTAFHYIQLNFFEKDGDFKITFLSMALCGFFVTAIYPFISSKILRK